MLSNNYTKITRYMVLGQSCYIYEGHQLAIYWFYSH